MCLVSTAIRQFNSVVNDSSWDIKKKNSLFILALKTSLIPLQRGEDRDMKGL